jgi:ribosomal protein L11 methyltransferase
VTADRWIEITLHVAPNDVDVVASVLSDLTGQAVAIEHQIRHLEDREFGFEELDAPVAVRAYAKPPLPDQRRTTIEATLQSLELSAPLPAPTYRDLNPTDWAEEWKHFYDIQHIGDRLVIRPSWIEYQPNAGEVVLDLDPGAAFGTGQHETTRLCLAAIERHLGTGTSVIDVGCGSGILAIAAARLGATEAWAVDTDPKVIHVTRENASMNGVATQIRAEGGSLGNSWPWPDHPPRDADLLVANISSSVVLLLLPEFARALAPGGRAVLSGFLAKDAQEIEAAAGGIGLSRLETRIEGDWACLVARSASS